MMSFLPRAALAVVMCLGCADGAGSRDDAAKGRVIFEDRFERSEIGPDWFDTGGGYSIVNGELRAKGARNRPLWLARPLPRDARIDFKARSATPDVDIKVEVFGDGRSRAVRASYVATSYVIIFGGWRNTRSIIARLDEHGRDRMERTEPRGEPGRSYAFSIVRKGRSLTWRLDGEEFLEMDDPEPLAGPGHDHFAFNDWESEVYFDDLVVREL